MEQNTTEIRVSAILIKAGYCILPIWLGLATIAGFFAEGYDPIASHVSVMTLSPGTAHMIANLAALGAGTALIMFGIGIWQLSGRALSVGALGWVIFGVSMLANGIWPMGGPMHGLYIIGIFNIIAPALSLLEIRDGDMRKRMLNITAFVSFSSILYLWIALNGFDPDGYQGLTQRLFGSINYLWPLVFAHQYFKRTR
ncbi:DUF998 domain-containing protein [Kordiimonas sp. SCSIO 12610]|uniref:DUF998 domain-containing protein n=1 Tax=Kordiimonas sp. SCSIO 12610 TaxID=2829597 RepID=UPI00210AE893|nr:DUF998 domain-containing protein [Kordiimonas sp. SCSIO 12610]UTW56050.1 DUF998 domain-containing protein [Kordiimonas sp. SCSIO 12610]